jgi:uncharacterized membrane protein YfcA
VSAPTLMADQAWTTVVFLAVVALISGLARGFSGFGSALIFIPLASAAVGPSLAAPILLVIDGIGAMPMLPGAWRLSDRRAVFIMSAGALVAVPIGTLALTRMDPVTLRWAISVAILGLVGLLASGWRYGGRPLAAVTIMIGLISGFFSGVAQIGGAPAIAYWLGSASSAISVRANMVLFLACSTIYTVVTYALSGLFTLGVVGLSLIAGPAYLAGLAIGMRTFGLASQLAFRRICFALIALAAIIGLPVFR